MDQLIRLFYLAYVYCQSLAVHVQLTCRTRAFGTFIIHFYTMCVKAVKYLLRLSRVAGVCENESMTRKYTMPRDAFAERVSAKYQQLIAACIRVK